MSVDQTSTTGDRHNQLLTAQALIDHSKAAIFVKDRAGRYVVVNEGTRRAFQAVGAEVLGVPDEDLLPPDEAAQLRHHDSIVLNDGDTIEYEEDINFHGTVRTYATVKFPVRDDGGVVVGLAGIATDITESKGEAVKLLIDGKLVVLDRNPELSTRARAEHQAAMEAAIMQLAFAALADGPV